MHLLALSKILHLDNKAPTKETLIFRNKKSEINCTINARVTLVTIGKLEIAITLCIHSQMKLTINARVILVAISKLGVFMCTPTIHA